MDPLQSVNACFPRGNYDFSMRGSCVSIQIFHVAQGQHLSQSGGLRGLLLESAIFSKSLLMNLPLRRKLGVISPRFKPQSVKPAGVGCDVGAPVAKSCEHDREVALKAHNPSEINLNVHRHTSTCLRGVRYQDAGVLILMLTMICCSRICYPFRRQAF